MSLLLKADCLTIGCLLALGAGLLGWLRGQFAGDSHIPQNTAPEKQPEPTSVYHEPPPVRLGYIITKLAGVTHPNPDGSQRQRLVSELRVGDTLLLRRDFENTHDPNAVTVLDSRGRQLGFLKKEKELSTLIAPLVETGQVTSAVVLSLTGGVKGREFRGVNIRIQNVPQNTVDKYLGQFPMKSGHQTVRDENGVCCDDYDEGDGYMMGMDEEQYAAWLEYRDDG